MSRATHCCAIAVCLVGPVACKGEIPDWRGFHGEAGASDGMAAPDGLLFVQPVSEDAGAFSAGPDGSAPVACDEDASAVQCGSPPIACTDPGPFVYYYGGQCVGGACRWPTANVSCAAAYDGGRCAPPGDAGVRGAITSDDAGTWAVFSPCMAPVAPAPPPPSVSCDAADAALCMPPPSVCADGSWLVYYDQGECIAGQCAWQERYARCEYGCGSGACSYPAITLSQ
jgi:hypothetical protein